MQTVEPTNEKNRKPPNTTFLCPQNQDQKLAKNYNNQVNTSKSKSYSRKCFKYNQINPILNKYSSVAIAEGLKQSGSTHNETKIKESAMKLQVSDQGLTSTSSDVISTKTYLQLKSGDHVVTIPLSNIAFCVSRQDIICTIGLSCQLTSLILAFILTILGFKISGKIVPIHDFFPAYYCLEAALIINSVVDPIICVAFSSDFRKALKDIILCKKK